MEIQRSLNNNECEIVRAEYFAYTNEPIITFNPARNLVYVNVACLKRFPDMDYANFLVFPAEKNLALRPCRADERHAVRVRSSGKNLSKPRYIRCEEFLLKIIKLTQWSADKPYRLLGNVIKRNDETMVLFELKSFSDEGFGVTLDEHLNNPIVKTFEHDTEISVDYISNEEDNNIWIT